MIEVSGFMSDLLTAITPQTLMPLISPPLIDLVINAAHRYAAAQGSLGRWDLSWWHFACIMHPGYPWQEGVSKKHINKNDNNHGVWPKYIDFFFIFFLHKVISRNIYFLIHKVECHVSSAHVCGLLHNSPQKKKSELKHKLAKRRKICFTEAWKRQSVITQSLWRAASRGQKQKSGWNNFCNIF